MILTWAVNGIQHDFEKPRSHITPNMWVGLTIEECNLLPIGAMDIVGLSRAGNGKLENITYSFPPTFLSARLPLATDLNVTTHSGMHRIALGTMDGASRLRYFSGHDDVLRTIARFVERGQ